MDTLKVFPLFLFVKISLRSWKYEKKGRKNKYWSAEEKFKIIEPIINFEKSSTQVTRETWINNGMITQWIHKFRKYGVVGLNNKKKPGDGSIVKLWNNES